MKQVTAVLVGAGLRGSEAYASYALKFPAEFKVVAVAEPDRERRERFAGLHGISEDLQFDSYEELLDREKLADCVMICTQDTMHYKPVVMALEKGYHVLCEKPMSPDREEMIKMGAMAGKYNRLLSICHVLRYSPFFVKIKDLLKAGRIGRLMSIQHIENVGYWHYAHSFVRGNWRRAEESSPMILAKCCHDMDILTWLAESSCTRISSFGGLAYFTRDNAPKEAPDYCLDGCPVRDECPYYAPRFYLEHPKAVEDKLIQAVSVDYSPHGVMEKLRQGPYGRCVFHCDNTVVDHQVVNLEYANGVNVSFAMSAFTRDCRREINLMGTSGQIVGDMEEGRIVIYDFVSGSREEILLNTSGTGHNGSDDAMMKEFIRQVSMDGQWEERTSAEVSVDSHLMALAAEASRVEGRVIDFRKYKEESVHAGEKA